MNLHWHSSLIRYFILHWVYIRLFLFITPHVSLEQLLSCLLHLRDEFLLKVLFGDAIFFLAMNGEPVNLVCPSFLDLFLTFIEVLLCGGPHLPFLANACFLRLLSLEINNISLIRTNFLWIKRGLSINSGILSPSINALKFTCNSEVGFSTHYLFFELCPCVLIMKRNMLLRMSHNNATGATIPTKV